LNYDKAELRLIDLAKFASVKAFANTFDGDEKGVDIVVMNAAVAWGDYAVTEDGWETT
jgi:retinol dehydrogenase 12